MILAALKLVIANCIMENLVVYIALMKGSVGTGKGSTRFYPGINSHRRSLELYEDHEHLSTPKDAYKGIKVG
jgi:hypothetical protein